MLGAIIGDLVGSPYEFNSPKTKHFPLFRSDCEPTDDSLMTIAVGCACVHSVTALEFSFKTALCKYMREIGKLYPNVGYGNYFYDWLMDDNAGPYGSIGNGSAMRVSPIGWAFDTLEETELVAKWSAEVTHDSDQGIRGAQAIAAAVFLARTGSSKDEIRDYIESKYYDLNFFGDYYRLSDPFTPVNLVAWETVAKDKSEALVTFVCMHWQCRPTIYLKVKGLDPDKIYVDQESGASYTGSVLMNAGLNLSYKLKDGDSYQIYLKA